MESLSIAEVKDLRQRIDTIEGYERRLKVAAEQIKHCRPMSALVSVSWRDTFYSVEMDEACFPALRELETKFKLDAIDIIIAEIARLKKVLLDEYGIVWEEK